MGGHVLIESSVIAYSGLATLMDCRSVVNINVQS